MLRTVWKQHWNWIRWLFLVAVIGWGLVSFRGCQRDSYRWEMPKELQLGQMVGADFDANPLAWCGGGGFEIADEVLAKIAADGLSFVETVPLPTDYDLWRATPAPTGWTSQGSWAGLACVGNRTVIEAAFYGIQEPGNYYAVNSSFGAIILVLPEDRMAVYTHDEYANWSMR